MQQVKELPKVIVRQHLQALKISTWLTCHFWRNNQPRALRVKARQVIQALFQSGLPCVLS
jgi:hypothetical protein